ncbi:MAG: PKD domain-containing protein [Deferrisomatales bacterium]|nr:PKD domain-containing protein [Deferrisomatales bacterium]
MAFCEPLQYQHDDLHRLTRVERPDDSVTVYQYDPFGNRTSKVVTGGAGVPTALFAVSQTTGPAPLPVTFTDQTVGTITTWEWDFDNDGTVDATGPTASYTYASPGTYTAKLTVTGPGGSDDETREITATADAAPVAEFIASPLTGEVPLPVAFLDQSTGTITSWAWDFDNDGTPDSTAQNPSFTYGSPGTYTIALTVTGPGGTSAPRVRPAYITVEAPVTGPVLVVGPVSQGVPATAGTTTFDVANTGIGTMAWTASSNAAWLAVAGGSPGSDAGTITLSYAANAGAARSGTVTITAPGASASPQTVTVDQAAAAGPAVSVESPSAGDLWTLGSTYDIQWTATSGPAIAQTRLYFVNENHDEIIVSLSGDPGVYSWALSTVGSYVSQNARIRVEVSDVNGATTSIYSGSFTVQDSAAPSAPWPVPERVTTVAGPGGTYVTQHDGTSAVAVDGAGNVHLVYVHLHDDITGLITGSGIRQMDQTLYYTKKTGGTWSAATALFSDSLATNSGMTGFRQLRNLRIEVDSAGRPRVAWVRDGPMTSWPDCTGQNGSEIYYTGFDGASWAAPVNVSSNGTESRYLDIAVSPDDSVQFAWVDGQTYASTSCGVSGTRSVYHRSLDAGGAWSATDTGTAAGSSPNWTALAAAPNGDVHLAYSTSVGIEHTNWDGAAWSSAQVVAAGDLYYGPKDLAVDASGAVHLVFGQYSVATSTRDVFYAVNATGSWAAAEKVSAVADTNQKYVAVAVTPGGTPQVVWYEDSGRILYRQRLPAGWSSVVQLNTSGNRPKPYETNSVSASMAPGEVLHVVWQSYFDVGDEVYHTSADVASDPTLPTVALIAPVGGEDVPANQDFLVTWDASDNTGIASAALEYSTDGGATFQSITTAAGTGAYLWAVPDVGTDTALVRVTVADYAGNTATDTSGSFRIVRADPVVASFTATPRNGPAPLPVQFADQSSGNPTSWFWIFGDGATSTERDPLHIYNNPGSFWVTLVATGPGGSDPHTEQNFITVDYGPPAAAFTPSTTDGPAPLDVTFTDASTGAITAWAWDFGDGETSTTPSPTHTYVAPGSYTATLTVSGPGGTSAPATADILVNFAAPVAAFAPSTTAGPAPLDVTFTDASTGAISSWAWDFGDGGTSTEQTPTHTYVAPGSYTATLTVTGPGGSDVVGGNILVNELPPDPAFTMSVTSGTAPLEVVFTDASLGNITFWAWDFGDGGTSTAASPTHTYTTPGSYTASLVVTGPGGASTPATASIQVDHPAPVAGFTPSTTTGIAPLELTFSDASTGAISSWAWDFGDGGTSTEASPTHTYSTPGEYTAALTVTGSGGTASTSTSIVVNGTIESVVLFADDFDDGAIDAAKWVYGGNRVAEEGGILKLEQNTTDGGGWAATVWLPLDGDAPLVLTRRALLHNNPSTQFFGSLQVAFDTLPLAFSVWYANHTYTCDRFGFYIGEAGSYSLCAHPFGGPAPAIWDQWFEEKIVYDPTTGILKYYTDGALQVEYPVGAAPADATAFAVRIDPYGWSTGHYQQTDDFRVSRLVLPASTFDPPAGPTNQTSQTLTGTRPYGATVQVSVGGGGVAGEVTYPTPTTWSCTVNGLPDGDVPVTVTVTDAAGQAASVTGTLVVETTPPVAAFTPSATTGTTPLDVTFTDESTGTIMSWAWDFGDGGTSTEQSPTHTYTAPGTYTVTLVVTGPGGSDTFIDLGGVWVSPSFDDPPFFATEPALAGWVTIPGTQPFSGTVDDDVGLASVSMIVSGPVGSGIVAFTDASVSGTTWDLSAYVFDSADPVYAGVMGRYEVELVVTDTSAQTASRSFAVLVGDPAVAPSVVWQRSGDYCVRGTAPALGDDGVLYVATSPACDTTSGIGTTAIDPGDGSILWGPVVIPQCTNFNNTVSVNQDGLVLGTGDWNQCGDGYLAALHSATGGIAWTQGTSGVGYSPHPRQVPAVDDALGAAYFGSSYLFSVDTASGTDNWVRSGGYNIGSGGMAVDSAGNVYYGSHNGSGNDDQLRSYTSAGVLRWARTYLDQGVRLLGILGGDRIALAESGGDRLNVVDTGGTTVWEAPGAPEWLVGDAAGNVYVGDQGVDAIVSFDTNGTERWRFTIPAAMTLRGVDLVDDQGHLYVRADNVLLVLDTVDGGMTWMFEAAGPLYSTVALTPGGRLFVSDQAANVYLLGTAVDYAAGPWSTAYGNRRHTGKVTDVLPLPDQEPFFDPEPTLDPVVQIPRVIPFSGLARDDLGLASVTMRVSGPIGADIVAFTDTSVNGTGWDLSGYSFDSVDPTYAGVPGVYTVELVIADSAGQEAIRQFLVTVTDAPWVWLTETVDADGDMGRSISLALDGDGNPGISYSNQVYPQQLKFAKRSAGSWTPELVKVLSATNYGTSLAFDSQSRPRIVYDNYSAGHGYAEWDGTQWSDYYFSTLPTLGALQVDASDRSHIAWYTGTNLEYRVWDGSAWGVTTVDSSGDLGYSASLALDGQGRRYVSYAQWGHSLKFAYHDGVTWSTEIVDGAIRSANEAHPVALDSQDRPHILYIDSDSTVKLAVKDAGQWQFTTVPLPLPAYAQFGTAIDGADRFHVAYAVDVGGSYELTHFVFDGVTWTSEVIDRFSAPQTDRPAVDLAVGADGTVHVAYRDADDLVLKYARTARDSDSDGLPDVIELVIGTDPFDADTDDDGLVDGNAGSEDLNANGVVDLGETDPLNWDTDGDGIFDGTERGLTAPETADTNLEAGHFVADADPSTTTDPTDADSDDDGIPDGTEDANRDGAVDLAAGETDPGDVDTDQDGIQDGTELGLTLADVGADTDLAVFVPDADPSTTTDPTKKDTDGDGIDDGVEDANHNGRWDVGETPSGSSFCAGDLTLDRWVDFLDLEAFAPEFGRIDCVSDCLGDLDGDGDVDGTDQRRLMRDWGRVDCR